MNDWAITEAWVNVVTNALMGIAALYAAWRLKRDDKYISVLEEVWLLFNPKQTTKLRREWSKPKKVRNRLTIWLTVAGVFGILLLMRLVQLNEVYK